MKEVARLCGIGTSGTKLAVAERIEEELSSFKPVPAGTRILSIDLGIRNLAYSLLTVPSDEQAKERVTKTKTKRQRQQPLQLPTLHAWERLALVPKPLQKKKSKAAQVGDVDPLAEAADVDLPISPQDFSPGRLSATAVRLVRERLLPLKPDVVTLEMQRFRSIGGPAVFEWTLRVNSLESMLYAVLTTLRDVGHWHGVIETVVPRHVLARLEDGEAEDAAKTVPAKKRRTTTTKKKKEMDDESVDSLVEEDASPEAPAKRTKVDSKLIKKNIVGRMLLTGTDVKIAEDATSASLMIQAYLDKWQRKPLPKKSKNAPSEVLTQRLKKLDDLADSLLQGIAFIKWQESRKKLLDGGFEAIQDQMRD